MYVNHENEKKRAYGQSVLNVEHGSFTPLFSPSTGGSGKEANVFLKRLVPILASEKDINHSHMIAWIKCRLSFLLLRSSLLCIRGARSQPHQPLRCCDISIEIARC